jgi:hypothetical protein
MASKKENNSEIYFYEVLDVRSVGAGYEIHSRCLDDLHENLRNVFSRNIFYVGFLLSCRKLGYGSDLCLDSFFNENTSMV